MPNHHAMRLPLAAAFCLACFAPAAFGQITVGRQMQPAQLKHDGAFSALAGGEKLVPTDKVRTVEEGRVELRLPGAGVLKLGGETQVEVHSANDQQRVARLKLLSGVAEAQPGGGDLRLNAGRLRLHLKSGTAWIEVKDQNETLCLMQGKVEFQFEKSPVETLHTDGVCLLFNGEQRMLLLPDADALARKRARVGPPGA